MNQQNYFFLDYKCTSLIFTDHRRQLLQNRYVYAVVSRRAKGLSIEMLNVDKGCNFDCPYCQVDRSIPLTDTQSLVKIEGVDTSRVQAELAHLFSLIDSGDLWQVPPFDTVAPENANIARCFNFR